MGKVTFIGLTFEGEENNFHLIESHPSMHTISMCDEAKPCMCLTFNLFWVNDFYVYYTDKFSNPNLKVITHNFERFLSCNLNFVFIFSEKNMKKSIEKCWYLRLLAHFQVGAHRMEGSRPTHIHMGLVKWLQHLYEISALPLMQKKKKKRKRKHKQHLLQMIHGYMLHELNQLRDFLVKIKKRGRICCHKNICLTLFKYVLV